MFNNEKSVLEVYHKDLKRADEHSTYRSVCIVCEDGIMPVSRDMGTGKILQADICLNCGQRYRYKDKLI